MKLLDNLFTITDLSPMKEGFDYRIRLNEECIIYKAHFPHHPVTPGVCIVQIATELYECATSQRVEIIGVKNVKFISVMIPSTDVFTYSFRKIISEDDTLKMQVTVTSSDMIYAKLSLICRQAKTS